MKVARSCSEELPTRLCGVARVVYLDESGDTGFKFNHGSTRYFVVTLLLVDDPIAVQAAIEELRGSLGFASSNEFKFSNSSHEVRIAFLEMMRRQNVSIRALVIDKTLMTQPHMRQRETFYQFLVKMVLTYDNGTIQNAMLVLDESVKSRKSKKQFTPYLRRSLNSGPNLSKIRDVRYHTSPSDNLIQAADMLCGAVYAMYHVDKDGYFWIIRSQVHDLWEWHPKTR